MLVLHIHVEAVTPTTFTCFLSLRVFFPGTISAKEILGTLRGIIKKLPTDRGPEGPQDGIIEYEKDGSMQEVRFGAQDVNEYLSTLAVNDEVSCATLLLITFRVMILACHVQ